MTCKRYVCVRSLSIGGSKVKEVTVCVGVRSCTLEVALGFLLCPKAVCHARLLFLKFKSILALLLKICLIAFEVKCKHLSLAYEALVRT